MNLRESFNAPTPVIVLAEGEFGKTGGKTSNGVVLNSELFDARVVVDSETAGESPASVLGRREAPEIPIVSSVSEALETAPETEALIIGVAPAGGELPDAWVTGLEEAIRAGCDVVSGLHTFLSEDEHWAELAESHDARIFDVRRPPKNDQLRVGDGSVDEVDADVVLTVGTDCAVGKRTTTFELYRAAREAGLDAGWVATGQTGIMVGSQAGVVIDRVPADFAAGVVEDLVKSVAEAHDLVFVEGQASLTHRAYSNVTLAILHGSWPDAVVIADDPERSRRTHFEQFAVEGVEAETALIQELSEAEVAGISTWGDPTVEQERHDLPVSNVYWEEGPGELLTAVRETLNIDVPSSLAGEGA
ncbi:MULTISPECIES: DUF1611 domain-containing protein [Halolamina]|uniref:Uncharacterized conserved protein, NAD-dependent epimerase/dehydratase family n=1 Tax=Halolamina pelagica TaxID=699431 RepID=A0A1I5WGG9_9EURY|nr:DUF1611 domain-containing protein [Halolamina sp. R1-12]SFQ18810.1 Uncharacterized conserved protein, NAD-dependent epimerase/dehydratase family [Halolamina pelagica]